VHYKHESQLLLVKRGFKVIACLFVPPFTSNRICFDVVADWDTFAKLREVTINFVLSVCLSVRPSVCVSVHTHGTTRIPLDAFTWHFIFLIFFVNLLMKFKFHWNPTRITGTLHGELCIFMIDKAIPLQAWTGPEGSRKLRLPVFKTIGTWRW